MNNQDATDLATRINQAFPRGLQTAVWEEELTPLDAGRAGTAIARLRRTETNLTIARFWAEYRTINTTDASSRPQIADCNDCQNTGNAPNREMVKCADGTFLEMDISVGPCHCPRGRDNEQTLTGIVDNNHAELDRMFPNRHQEPTPNPRRSTAA